MNKNRYLRMIGLTAKYDLRSAIRLSYKKVLLFVFITFVFCITYYKGAKDCRFTEKIDDKAGYCNYVVNAFSGMREPMKETSEKFLVPIYWLVTQLFVALLVGSYITDDMKEYGMQLILRTRKRSIWLLGKSVYVLFCNIFLYISMYACIFIYVAIFENNLESHRVFDEVCSYVRFPEEISEGTIILLLFVMPVLSSIAISMIQMLLIMCFNPIIAYIGVAIYVVASAYRMSYMLLGNYSMVLRSDSVVYGGIEMQKALLCVIGVVVVSYILSYGVLRRKNIM